MKFTLTIQQSGEGSIGDLLTSVVFDTMYWPEALDTILGQFKTHGFTIDRDSVLVNSDKHVISHLDFKHLGTTDAD